MSRALHALTSWRISARLIPCPRASGATYNHSPKQTAVGWPMARVHNSAARTPPRGRAPPPRAERPRRARLPPQPHEAGRVTIKPPRPLGPVGGGGGVRRQDG